jgi:hypothetical protein
LSPLRLSVWIADSFLLGDDNPEAIPLCLPSRVLSKFALRAYGGGELALLPLMISRSTQCEGKHLLCSVITSARGGTLMA